MIILLRTLGFLALAAGLLWMVIAEIILEESRSGQVRLLLVGGIVFLVLSVVLSAVSKVKAKVSEKRCPRCGRPVQHGHIYCTDHLKEAVNQFRDSQRRKDEGT